MCVNETGEREGFTGDCRRGARRGRREKEREAPLDTPAIVGGEVM